MRFLVAPWEYFWWAFEIAASLAYLEVIKFLQSFLKVITDILYGIVWIIAEV